MDIFQNNAGDKPVVIVGAGISGLTLSILFKTLNKKVVILEKRSVYRTNDAEDPRSFNLTVTERGMKSFREIGIEQKVLDHSVPLKTRVVHAPSSCICNQKKVVQSYGTHENDKIFSIKRSDLINIIYEEAKKNTQAEILFDSEVIEIDKINSTLTYRSRTTGQDTNLSYEFLIGADGTYSKVRNFLLTGEIVDLHINYFRWIYKKFLIPANDAKILGMDPLSLHVFSQKGALAVAIPNQDQSFSSIYCTDMQEFSDLKSDQSHKQIENKFMKDFPHLFYISEKLRDTFRDSKISGLVDVNLSKWRYNDKIVLVGDAAHAVFPFYGQGMNSALQDCRILVSLLASKESVGKAFAEYEAIQKKSTNALSDLCRAHFNYLQEKSFSPFCQAQRQLDQILRKLNLFSWHSEYGLVAQTELPYNQVCAILKRQNFFRKLFGLILIDYFLTSVIVIARRFSSIYTQLKRC